MIPPSFEYHAPGSVADAIALLSQYGDAAKILAGGHSLLPMMKLRFAEPEHLVDINNIDSLKGIREEDGEIVIGSMTSESALITSTLLQEKCPMLPEAAKMIADPQVRNRGTIGGDISHGDPGNDHPALMLALDATFTLVGPNGARQIAAADFFLGTFFTALEADEILTEIRIAPQAANTGASYQKLKRKTGDYATAAAAAVITLSGDTCQSAAIALTNLGATAMRASAAEAVLVGQVIDEDLIKQAATKAMEICEPAEDLRGDAEYKTHMGGEMTRRAIRAAIKNAGGN
ncbi:MAG: xanthine dehydrogenase family protein subunit M [Gammaproteobacteria bacterium]|nr:xanthine dehydrogenase family protein subunit M [Gammaproteobacteria bacterium]MDH3450579.1 xanthine dehydrogenase family protein subunit M [Gammaproteobacteria bacterium]